MDQEDQEIERLTQLWKEYVATLDPNECRIKAFAKFRKRLRNQDSYKKNADKKQEYQNIRYSEDPKFRLCRIVRERIRTAFNYYKLKKDSSEYGIDFDAIFEKIGVCPDGYHLDHIIPISAFDLDNPEHVRLAHIPENLRWIPAKENLKKSNRICADLILGIPELVRVAEIIGLDLGIQKVA